MTRIESLGGETVLIVDEDEGPVDGRAVRNLVMAAHEAEATTLAVVVEAFDARFFDLASGLAGDILQACVTYRMRLAVVGELPAPASGSRAFAALVRESNRGRDVRFVRELDELAG